MDRRETLNLFLSHAPALHITLERVYSTYSLEVEITGESYRALVLARSRDYWLQRIHLHRQRPTLAFRRSLIPSHLPARPCSRVYAAAPAPARMAASAELSAAAWAP